MPLLLETIKVENGVAENLSYHQERLNRSRKELFELHDTLKLSSAIEAPKKGLYRCRILYGKTIHSVEYIPYKSKKIQSLNVVSSNITYAHKYADRKELNSLLNSQKKDIDEIIIEKDGYLTDTTIANIAFYDGKRWFTPKKPLLKGTMRAKLLNNGFLQVSDIKKEDISKYTHMALMNSMIGFNILNENITIKGI